MSAPEIWLVDDDASIRYVMAEALQDAGYRARGFESAAAAMAELRAGALPALLFPHDGHGFTRVDLQVHSRQHLDIELALLKATTHGMRLQHEVIHNARPPRGAPGWLASWDRAWPSAPAGATAPPPGRCRPSADRWACD